MIQYEQQLYTLTDKFYNDYPSDLYPELLIPHGHRTYNCLVVEYKNYFICIPFRSDMRHKNGYRFRNTVRSKNKSSGLDYSKMVIIKNSLEYLSSDNALVDRDEYIATIRNSDRIVSGAIKYLDNYIGYQKGEITLNINEYNKRYLFSTLSYFHDILGI